MADSKLTQDYITDSGVTYKVTKHSYWSLLNPLKISHSYDVVIMSPSGDVLFQKNAINRGINIVGIIQLAASGDVITGSDNSSVLLQGLSAGTYVSVPGSTGNFVIGAGALSANTYYIGGDTSITGLANIGTGTTVNVIGGNATLSGTGSTVIGLLSGSKINIEYGGTFNTGSVLAGALTGSTINFGDGGGTLVINGGSAFIDLLGSSSVQSTVINNYDPSRDTIRLEGTTKNIARYTISGNSLYRSASSEKIITLYGDDGEKVAQYAVNPAPDVMLMDGDYTADDLNAATNPLKVMYVDNGTNIGSNEGAACFLAGSEVKVINGQIAIENLKKGDQVVTFDWQKNCEIVSIISWVGKNRVKVKPYLPDDLSGYPVCVLKNAIADGVPYKDMFITADHSLFFQEKFVPVRMLVNGRSIFYDKTITAYDYYHIETESHSVISVDGMLTESYLHTDNHITFKRKDIQIKKWEIDSCAPLCVERNFVETIHNAIQKRAEKQKYAIQFNYDSIERINDHGICIVTEKKEKLRLVRSFKNSFLFCLPAHVTEITIHSYSNRPCDSIGPFVDDRRNLGVLIEDITIIDGDKIERVNMHLTKDNLIGWNSIENNQYRWTNGDAYIALDMPRKKSMGLLKITILSGGPYILDKNSRSQLMANSNYSLASISI